MTASASLEHRLAMMTNWAFFASFGFCFVMSGFTGSSLIAGFAGFSAFVVGFVVNVIINRTYGVGFTNPQIALGLALFTISIIGFIASWIFDPSFDDTDVFIGIVGFGAIMACFIVYVVINYGVRESYAMMHRLHMHERHRP